MLNKKKPALYILIFFCLAIVIVGVVIIVSGDSSIKAVNLPAGTTEVAISGTSQPAATIAQSITTAAVTTTAITATPDLPTATVIPATDTPAAKETKPASNGINPGTGSTTPVRLRIPILGVDTSIEQVGITRDGSMDVPSSAWTVGWYSLGTKPGENGNAVIDGHLDSVSGPAIFWNLKNLQPGNKIYVTNSKGQELVFEVTSSVYYPYDGAPINQIFGDSPEPHLNLITCSGIYDRKAQNYDKRLVVYSKFAGNQ